jgi:outer membrane protein TolC
MPHQAQTAGSASVSPSDTQETAVAELSSPLLNNDNNQPRIWTVAVVSDGPCHYFDNLVSLVQKELNVLVDENQGFVFKRGPGFNAGWDIHKIPAVLQHALQDKDTDMIFAAGLLVAEAASQAGTTLSKPVVSGFIQDPDTLGLPYDEQGYSTKSNFNFVVTPLRTSRDLEVFHQMVPYKRLGIVADKLVIEGLDQNTVRQGTESITDKFNAQVDIFTVGRQAEPLLSQISNNVDAVYLTPALRMSEAEWQKVINGINSRKLPTFSLMGHPDVRLGVLAGLAPECSDRLARRLALNMQQIMMGTPPRKLQVNMALEESLMINAQTAVEINYSLPLELMASAKIIHKEALAKGDTLNMQQAVVMALEHNAELSIQKAATESAKQEKNQAFSPLIPNVEGNGQYSQIDKDTADASMGMTAEKKTSLGVEASQILFNDPLISQYFAQRHRYQGSVEDLENTRLDIIKDAADAYIQFLQARALLLIEIDNLQLTQSNLELAKVRHKVGTAGPEEVYRWESQSASQKATVRDAQSQMDNARIALNRIMGVSINEAWKPRDIKVTTNNYHFLDERLENMVDTQTQLDAFDEYVVQQALDNDPQLKSLEQSIRAQQLVLNQYKRRFIAPEVTASFTYDYAVDREFASDPQDEPPDDEWVAAIKATLPLFEGGGRFFDIAAAKAGLDQLKETHRQAREYVEQTARAVLYDLRSSLPNVHLQREAADYSMKNLNVIKDKYARGVVSILDLLDAQNQAFVANQNAAIAVYTYLQDIVELQRAMSWFEFEQSEAAKDAWVARLEGFMKARGVPIHDQSSDG